MSTAILTGILLAACGGGGGEAGSGSGGGGITATHVGVVAVPETGVIRCTDATGAAMDCANTGQDGDLRAGVVWPNPRFTVDGTGNCITDNLTGLMWARGDGGFRTWQLALDFANSLDLCGFTDWRMPNRKELLSLVNYGAANIGIDLLNNGFTFQVESVLWSSSSITGSATEAWTLIVLPGVVSQGPKSGGNYVLPVRAAAQAAPADLPQSGQTTCTDAAGAAIACANTGQDGNRKAGVAWPDPRFSVDGTGNCITDNLTGLIWVRNPDAAARTWQQALEFANGLALCGATDWRLPNINELDSLVNLEVANQATFLNGQGFGGVQADSYWSSSIWAGFGSGSVPLAWAVTMASGGMGPIDRSASRYVLPVRARR